ncbi:hypothetical protein PoB_003637700 [Plakobranchus ocellatus]|uniref:Uncharacterized protein n=1 Tax=Plakobranchus ocellatus TaxID=259542 RepID=A0AAV4ASG8_9GAST|nr:hypothetical protein PoB_003637700 [Plakobranchus ocellatus]
MTLLLLDDVKSFVALCNGQKPATEVSFTFKATKISPLIFFLFKKYHERIPTSSPQSLPTLSLSSSTSPIPQPSPISTPPPTLTLSSPPPHQHCHYHHILPTINYILPLALSTSSPHHQH